MLRYGYNMSLKTMGKGLVSSIVSRQIVGNVGKGAMSGLNEYYEYVSTGDTNGISSFHIFMYRQLLGRGKNPIFSF